MTERGIAVVVLTHNRLHLLRRCVQDVLGRTSPLTEEIVIWDNASTDGTSEYLDSLDDPRLRIVHHPRNIGQNGYAHAFRRTSAEYLIELDDDVIEAPPAWDRQLLDAYRRLPQVGFLAADLVDDPDDQAARVRWHERPHLYSPLEVNGVRLLAGPAGGGCAMTSRTVHDLVGGFAIDEKKIFWLEDASYIERIASHGFSAAVLRDLRVHHAGGPAYATPNPHREAYWRRYHRSAARRTAVKRALVRVPFVRRLNGRYGWFVAPDSS